MPTTIHQQYSTDVHQRQLAGNEIRILKLGSKTRRTVLGAANTSVEAELAFAALPQADFVAISYVWGDSENPVTMGIDMWPFKVTRNLYNILQILTSTQPRDIAHASNLPSSQCNNFWIDAICINQEDEVEKAAQVNMMRSIYQAARYTLVCLAAPGNKEIEDDALAMDWLRRLHQSMRLDVWLASKERRGIFWNPGAYSAVADMMNSPWFHRRWIIQEVAVSKDAWVLYGSSMMPWADFSDAVEKVAYLFSDQSNRPGFQIDGSIRAFDIEPLFAICRLRTVEQGHRLLDIISGLRRCNTSDRRDRIFALLGLCWEHEAAANEAIYGDKFSMYDVCLRFARSHILLYENLDILCIAREEARIQRFPGGHWVGHIHSKPSEPGLDSVQFMPDLPTWAPNLTSFYTQWLHGHDAVTWRDPVDPYFSASAGCEANIRNLADLSQSKSLEVAGIEIDTVAAIEMNTPVPHPDWQNPHSIVFENMYSFAKQHCAYHTPEGLLTAYFRTISAGGRRDGTRHFLNDQGLRSYFLAFFAPSRFGRILRDREGFVEPEPETFADWYTDREAAANYTDNPLVFLTKLCFGVLAATEKRKLALLPSFSQHGDKICVIFGCSSPIVLQPIPQHPGQYRVRGEACMDGMMFGEAIMAWRAGRLQKTTFVLE